MKATLEIIIQRALISLLTSEISIQTIHMKYGEGILIVKWECLHGNNIPDFSKIITYPGLCTCELQFYLDMNKSLEK